MPVIEIERLDHPGVEVFASMTEPQLRGCGDGGGLFIAESPKVIEVALRAGYRAVSMLCERKHIAGDAAGIISNCGDMPVYTGERELLRQLTGYTLTRGVLCAMERRPMPTVESLCKSGRRIAVIDEVSDTTNIGAIFRSAAALGIDAVLLTRRSCDPLNRRSIRVSMGSVFLVPWTWLDEGIESLGKYGLKTAAMALSDNSVSIDDEALCAEPRLAIVLGSEGYGLSREVIEASDYVVKIPMAHGVDSLNVAAASAVAFWQLRVR
ncbi:MAG: RNA methyltransferase [Muribaculaceae bacterium]|nr:RNA methyltransferase [Muribaculaceae bacterium]